MGMVARAPCPGQDAPPSPGELTGPFSSRALRAGGPHRRHHLCCQLPGLHPAAVGAEPIQEHPDDAGPGGRQPGQGRGEGWGVKGTAGRSSSHPRPGRGCLRCWWRGHWPCREGLLERRQLHLHSHQPRPPEAGGRSNCPEATRAAGHLPRGWGWQRCSSLMREPLLVGGQASHLIHLVASRSTHPSQLQEVAAWLMPGVLGRTRPGAVGWGG